MNSRYGSIDFLKDGDLISKFLKEYGEWAYLECEFVSTIITAGASIFDLGAFIGTFSLGLNTFSKDNRYLAVELNPECWTVLDRNLSSNLNNYFVFKGIVTDSNSKLTEVDLSWDLYNQGSTNLNGEGSCNKKIVVETSTIRNLADRYFIPDLIKLDLEGGELQALKSTQNWISQHKPILWIECNEGHESLDIYSWLDWMGYEVYYFAFPSHNPDNFFSNPTALFPFAYEAGLLAFEKGKVEPALSESLSQKGCILQRVDSKQSLKKALWQTPRWCHKDWLGLTHAQLIALLTRNFKEVSFESFLRR
ncbi:FkbM family methyltransferase [Shewanella sp. MEBiC00475]|uniref:FkbM family methyltransferase n=1 Tax=Shewanella sp. MEBiC00475 TaxID=2575361 RepID=UPI0010BFE7C9|nr:FkbM family methyltransferase [Shewanella sp. MEBiC00475]